MFLCQICSWKVTGRVLYVLRLALSAGRRGRLLKRLEMMVSRRSGRNGRRTANALTEVPRIRYLRCGPLANTALVVFYLHFIFTFFYSDILLHEVWIPDCQKIQVYLGDVFSILWAFIFRQQSADWWLFGQDPGRSRNSVPSLANWRHDSCHVFIKSPGRNGDLL